MSSTKGLAIGIVGLILLLLPGLSLAISGTGTGPENALLPTGEWEQLDGGEAHWVAFQYAGDGSQVEIRLQVEPHGSVGFAVWTPQEIRDRGLGLDAQPVGRGSADPFAEGSLVWSGNFAIAGTYYVVVEREDDQPGLACYLLQIDGDGVSFAAPVAPGTPEPEPAKAPSGRPTAATTSLPTGKLVFQTAMGGDLYVINADGRGLRRLTDGADPAWSPDGGQIAFVRWRNPRGLWVIRADGSDERWVFDWNEVRWPSWAPDGSRILFSRQHGGRPSSEKCFWGFCFPVPARPYWRLGTVRLGDGDLREPPCSQISLAPMRSRDGQRIVYSDQRGLRVQSEDGEVSYLITRDASDTSPAWSPDGQRVVFTRRQHDHWEIYGVDADGRNLQRLTETPLMPDGRLANSASPAWSPDGRYIAFLSDRTGRWEIWLMRANGSEPRAMFDGALAGLALEYGHVGERAISWTW
jgi:TolB protein